MATFVIIGIILCAMHPVTIIANLLTIIAFMKVPSLQTHTSNLLIFALSIADLICGVYQILYYGIPFAFGLRPPLGEIGCMMTIPFERVYYAGNLLLLAISIDRVLLVSMDYSKYVKMITKLRLKVTIVICFLVGQIPAVVELSTWNYAKRVNANAASINFEEVCLYPAVRLKWYSVFSSIWVFFMPPLLVGTFSIIFFKRLLIRINKNRRVVPDTDSSNRRASGNQDEIARPPVADEDETAKKRYIKPAVTLAALVSAMCISMLPNFIYRLVQALRQKLNPSLSYIMWLILQLNPFLDPLFFAATQKGIKEFYGKKIRALFAGLLLFIIITNIYQFIIFALSNLLLCNTFCVQFETNW